MGARQPPKVDGRLARGLADALGPWFEREARELSFRGLRDPYAIWVSEVMAQQTRIETVEAYFGRFIARFPSVHALAEADESEVLEVWSGLGYYRRARLLHRGARYVVDELEGRIPGNADELRAVPGIGPYTAGAVASIAFDRPDPLVDGNVARVFSRVRAIEDPTRQDAKNPEHWALAAAVLEKGRPSVLAQALMELGALVCTPRQPACEVCPIAGRCRARRAELVEAIPAPRKRAAASVHVWQAVAVRFGSKVLLERRPTEGLLGGMWCMPLVPADEDVASALAWLEVPLRSEEGASQPARVRHVFSHRVWELDVKPLRAARRPKVRGRADGRELGWWSPAGGDPAGGMPEVTRKLLRALAAAS